MAGAQRRSEGVAGEADNGTILNELAVYDVAGIRRLVSSRHRMTRRMEREAVDRRYLVTQPNLDESSWRLYGQLPEMAGRVLVEALGRKADALPNNTRHADPFPPLRGGWQRPLGR